MHADWAKAITTTTGTGSLTLSAVTGFPTPYQAMGTMPFAYALLNSSGQPVEAGIGAMTNSTTMARTRVNRTWDGSTLTKVSATAASLTGTTTVICTPLDATAESMLPTVDSVSSSITRMVGSAARNAATAAFTPTSLRLYHVPFLLRCGAVISALGCNVTTQAAAGGQALIGIYAIGADGYFGAQLAATSAFAVDSTGVKTPALSSSVFLPPGWYGLAFVYSGTSLAISGHTASSANMIGGTPLGIASGGVVPVDYRYETVGSLALPSSAAASTTGVNLGNAACPMLFMGVV